MPQACFKLCPMEWVLQVADDIEDTLVALWHCYRGFTAELQMRAPR